MTRPKKVLVVGDVMIDLLVRPEGPLAIGSDRRAKIVACAGGSAANQAVWLAHFGVAVTFVGRVAARDWDALTSELRACGVDAQLAADDAQETGRLIALIDPSGERSFLTDRGANDCLCEGDIADPMIAGAEHIHLSGYSFVSPSPREAVIGLIGRAGRAPVSVDPASAEFLREVGPDNFLAWTRGAQMLFPNSDEAAILTGSSDPETQIAELAAASPWSSSSVALKDARRPRARSAGEFHRQRSRRSTRRARATPSSRRSWPRGSQARRWSNPLGGPPRRGRRRRK